jgi:hypothetical protein
MAANTATSSTGTAAGTDPNFTVTYKASRGSNVYCYLKYTKGTNNLAITFDVINDSLHPTDKYRVMFTEAATTAAAFVVTLAASANVRIPLCKIPAESVIVANLTFAGSAGNDIVVCNFIEE